MKNRLSRFSSLKAKVAERRRDTIMLPAGAFQEFLDALSRLVEFEAKL
jgi:hypothetical protein